MGSGSEHVGESHLIRSLRFNKNGSLETHRRNQFLGPYWVRWGSSECQSEYFSILKLRSKILEKKFWAKNKKVSGGSFRRGSGPGVGRAVPGEAQLVF